MEERITHTDMAGVYILKDIIVGPYVVMIGDTWEWHETFTWRAPAQEGIHVTANNVYTKVDFSLTPGGVCRGSDYRRCHRTNLWQGYRFKFTTLHTHRLRVWDIGSKLIQMDAIDSVWHPDG